MLSQYLQTVTGIGELGIISLVAAVTAFAGVVVYAFRLDRDTLEAMAALPLESDTPRNEGVEGGRP
jgi:hypothetical protein